MRSEVFHSDFVRVARFAFQACAFIRLRSRATQSELRRDVSP
jgi:hypothetical protein